MILVRNPFLIFLGLLTLTGLPSFSQNADPGQIHGTFESYGQYYNPDSTIGAPPVPEKFLFNGYSNLNYIRGNFKAGLRFESYHNVLQGIDPRYKGNGIPFRFATYTVDNLEVTVGNFYEQFGSGLALRLFEERGLGIDNCMDGVRARFEPFRGIYLKGLIGKQRLFFNTGPGIIRGFDGEINFNELIPSWTEKKLQIILGGSFVSKFQPDANPNLILPQNVGLSAGRFQLGYGDFQAMGEYAYKINDPSYDNNYIYNHGEAILLQLSYSKKGMAFLLGGKYIDNFSYKSDRDMAGNFLTINFNPALVKPHTYGLMTFWPYASQNPGEIAGQAEFLYKFKKETLLGGKYGTDLNINYSRSQSLDTTGRQANENLIAYDVEFLSPGDNIFFQDLNIEISKKLSPKFKGTLMLSYQQYDIAQIQGKAGQPDLHSYIAVLDLTYRFSEHFNIRTEAQHLYLEQDERSWAMGLIELNFNEKFYIAALDQYNYGHYNPAKRLHYVTTSMGYVKNTTRITVGYGKQRAGIFCVGGICRFVPASNGFTLAVSTSF